MRALTLAICAATALAPLTASAATAAAPAGGPQAADARCLLTMATISSVQDEATARSAQIGLVFFAGRLRAREPAFDFATRLKAVAAQMAGVEIKSELQRCGPIVSQSMNQLDAALRALSPPAPAPASTPRPPAPGK